MLGPAPQPTATGILSLGISICSSTSLRLELFGKTGRLDSPFSSAIPFKHHSFPLGCLVVLNESVRSAWLDVSADKRPVWMFQGTLPSLARKPTGSQLGGWSWEPQIDKSLSSIELGGGCPFLVGLLHFRGLLHTRDGRTPISYRFVCASFGYGSKLNQESHRRS